MVGIINIALCSMFLLGPLEVAAYGASKAAVDRLRRRWRWEWSWYGCDAIAPETIQYVLNASCWMARIEAANFYAYADGKIWKD